MIIQHDLFQGKVEVKSDRDRAIEYLEATHGIGTPSIASISEGRSSAYMALHYKFDRIIFAIVLTDDPACQIKDKGLRGRS